MLRTLVSVTAITGVIQCHNYMIHASLQQGKCTVRILPNGTLAFLPTFTFIIVLCGWTLSFENISYSKYYILSYVVALHC